MKNYENMTIEGLILEKEEIEKRIEKLRHIRNENNDNYHLWHYYNLQIGILNSEKEEIEYVKAKKTGTNLKLTR